MKTEVNKYYKWGFRLSEVELRRVSQTCLEHMQKVLGQEEIRTIIDIKLKDGSKIESSIIDDVFQLENSGSKQIERVGLQYDDGKKEPDYKILIHLQDATKNPDDWISIDFTVIGQSRDWAFLASADIDERLKKIKQISSVYITENKWFVLVPFMLGMLLFFIVITASSTNVAEELEAAYKSGLVKDPIEALIFVERTRTESVSSTRATIYYIISIMSPTIVLYALGKLLNIIAPAYNFYWGDYIAYYDKRRSAQNIFWTVIVLGIIVSVLSTYIMRLLP